MRPKVLWSREWEVAWLVSSLCRDVWRSWKTIGREKERGNRMCCGPEEGACSGWGTGGGLVSVDHRFSVREVLPAKRQAGVWAEALHNQVEQYQFDMLGNRKRLWFSLQGWPVCRECAVGAWAAEIVNFWIRLFILGHRLAAVSMHFILGDLSMNRSWPLHSILWGWEIWT